MKSRAVVIVAALVLLVLAWVTRYELVAMQGGPYVVKYDRWFGGVEVIGPGSIRTVTH